MSLTHEQVRAMLEGAWNDIVGRDYSTQEVIAVMAVASHETQYGAGWKAAMVGSWNMGAIQCSHGPNGTGRCPPGCAPYGDSHANGQKYNACFKTYPTADAGLRDLLEWFAHRIDTLDAATSCIMHDFATTMHKHGYFEGVGMTPEQCILSYAGALQRCAEAICKSLGEPSLFVLLGPKSWDDEAVASDGGGERA